MFNKQIWKGVPQLPRICPNATWSPDGITILNASYYYMYSGSIADYFVDVNGSIYVANFSANHIIKYAPGNLTVSMFMGSGSYSPYLYQRMTVDPNGIVYTSEYRVCC